MPSSDNEEDEQVRLLSDHHDRKQHDEKPGPQLNPFGQTQSPGPRKFVLCFDGTGNKFSGTDSDSNILKIFRMLDRSDGSQFHYYQPGIGTYVTTGSLSHTSHWQRFQSWYAKAKDSAVGTSFAEHVMGGYKFLMRYYLPGDEIYFFGFSRGAYIARFLAEMLDHVGLLTAGNEEMARFAWKTFQKWQTRQERNDEEKKQKKHLRDFMCAFRETFSRPVRRIRFLGLFDTVNSVPAFEGPWMQRSKFPYTARSTAKIIRHAVAIDERRAKFRQDLISETKKHTKSDHHHHFRYSNRSGANVPGADGAAFKPENGAQDGPEAAHERRNQFARSLGVPPFRDTSETSGIRSLSPGLSSRRGGHGHRSNMTSVSRSSSAAIRHARGYESDEDEEQDIQEVWFAGCHADIGGGWGREEEEDSSLSHVPLVWMVREAQRAGLQFDDCKLHALNCCPDEEDVGYGLGDGNVHGGHEANGESANETTLGAPEIQISAATPPLDSSRRSASYGLRPPPQQRQSLHHPPPPPPPRANARSPARSDSGAGGAEEELATNNKPTEEEPHQHSRFHALLHNSATRGKLHDVLCFNNGAAHLSVVSWNVMEWFPFRRMDLTPDGSWRSIAWPLPKGEVRDIPHDVVVHGSVLRRMQHQEGYRPGNLIVGGGGRGVRKAPKEMGMGEWKVWREEGDPVGEVWVKKELRERERCCE